MKIIPLSSVPLALLIMLVSPICGNAKEKDSVTIIKITDRSQIPPHLKIRKEAMTTPATDLKTKATAQGLDSSRIVKRSVKDLSEKPTSWGNLKLSKSVYGSYTDYILDYVKNYHKNHGSRITRIQSNNRGQFKLIENIMRKHSLPKEMKSLAVIESAMNCNAVSPVGAVGPWQFMEGTAKMLGLRVDGSLDERKDFYKSTNAAARYLKYLHGMFKDWFLVIAAYNCGPAPVLRNINSGLGRSFWDIKKKLPGETQNHVMAFIATTCYLDKTCNIMSFGAIPKDAKVPKADLSSLNKSFAKANYVTPTSKESDDTEIEEKEDVKKPQFSQSELDNMAVLKVKGTYKVAAVAKVLDEDPVRMARWNPSFDEDIKTASAPIQLRIPLNKLEKFIISKEQIIAESRK